MSWMNVSSATDPFLYSNRTTSMPNYKLHKALSLFHSFPVNLLSSEQLVNSHDNLLTLPSKIATQPFSTFLKMNAHKFEWDHFSCSFLWSCVIYLYFTDTTNLWLYVVYFSIAKLVISRLQCSVFNQTSFVYCQHLKQYVCHQPTTDSQTECFKSHI